MPDQYAEVPDAEEALLAGESEAFRLQWKARKAALIEEGLPDIRAGQVISFKAVSAWIDSLGTDHELPRPEPGQ
jgi:predicted transcriptional regulator